MEIGLCNNNVDIKYPFRKWSELYIKIIYNDVFI